MCLGSYLRILSFFLLVFTELIVLQINSGFAATLKKHDGIENIEKTSARSNLIENSEFIPVTSGLRDGQNRIAAYSDVKQWTTGDGEIEDTVFMVRSIEGKQRALGIKAGNDRQGKWRTVIPTCTPQERYRFEADFYRYNRFDSGVYPEVKIWGRRNKLNTHRMYGRFQRLFVEMSCPETTDEEKSEFVFINKHPGVTFWMKNPFLFKLNKLQKLPIVVPNEPFYPLGAYGADSKNIARIKETGFNSAVIQLNRKNIQTCLDVGIHCTFGVPREPKKLEKLLENSTLLLRKGKFSFYVNDEPGIHSFPVSKARAIQEMLKRRFPKNFTSMAVVRPQVVPEYKESADYFMLDQYPVPNMPMTWLSDSMDEAALYVGRRRLQSVIQAFGGEKYASSGWPRLPTFEEMNCLAYLSVVHGSRGIYFYSYPEITATEEGKADLIRLIRRLNSMQSWLLVHNDEQVRLKMVSDYRYGPKGKPAVHCARKEQYDTQMLICVNTLRTYTEAEVDVDSERSRYWQEYFTGELYYVAHDNLLVNFDPLEVKVIIEKK